ncbi:sensor histidine kinase [Acidocella facilis]|uniref:sensor histidine kinase n=1 Tax=Acidocella facilis TaxID=525 RepID=UPI00068BCF20|nr:HAMP domain-containing sensor histidine kinase [Acidocella facilis]
MISLKRLRQLNFRPQPASLSSKVLWVTVIAILLMDLLVLLPGLGQRRQEWLEQRVVQARLASYALLQNPSAATIDDILRHAGVQRLKLLMPDHQALRWQINAPLPRGARLIDSAREGFFTSICRALEQLTGGAPREEAVRVPDPDIDGAMLEVLVDTTPLALELKAFARSGFDFALVVALLTGLLVYTVLNWLLVRPMEVLISAIIHFRESPEEQGSAALDKMAADPKDDIARAAAELKIMQDELRAALWRNARLAAVGTSVAKIAHDLRNILSSALLVADRLQDVQDPLVQRATRTLVPAVERATQFVARTVDFAREGPPPVNRTPVRLHALAEEVAQSLVPEDGGWAVVNQVPAALVLQLDQAQLYRVLANLIRNAAEAGATRITLSTETEGAQTRLLVTDNGPGLPARAQANLFRPFSGSARSGGTGLGLAIARDLIRAHGGELVMLRTGPAGTIFRMDLTTPELQDVPLRA